MQSTPAMPDFAMWNLFFMGDENGVNQIPGETQGYWWSTPPWCLPNCSMGAMG